MSSSTSWAPKMPFCLFNRTKKGLERKEGKGGSNRRKTAGKAHIFCAKTHLDATFRGRFRRQLDRFRHHGHAVEACLLPPVRLRGIKGDLEVFEVGKCERRRRVFCLLEQNPTVVVDWQGAPAQEMLPGPRKFEPLFLLPNPHLLAWLLPPDPPRSLSVGAR